MDLLLSSYCPGREVVNVTGETNKRRSLSSLIDPAENPETLNARILGFLRNAMLYYFLSRYKL